MHRLTLRIEGRVQGVGFRWFVLREAQRQKLVGYVRNVSDGSVEIVTEGPADALARLEMACREGPPASHVTKVSRSLESISSHLYTSFDIR